MAQIRRDLHEDVKGVVQGAEAATDWRRFIRNYPWASMGVALAVGYVVVPRRHRPTTTVQIAAPTGPAQVIPIESFKAAEPEKKKGKGLVGTLFGLVAPVALRAVQGYALQFAEQWMAQRVAQQMQLHPELASVLSGQQQAQKAAPGSPRPNAGPPTGPRF